MSYAGGKYPIALGQNTQIETAQSGIGSFVLANESAYTITVSFPGTASSATLHALTIDNIAAPPGYNGNILLSPIAVLANAQSAPSAIVIIDIYGSNEKPAGTYPVALSRLSNVGNPINTNVSTIQTSLINDGAAGGTTIIESTPAGKPQAVLMDNNGNLTLGDTTNYGASLTVNGSTHLASTFTAKLDTFDQVRVHSSDVTLDNAHSIRAIDTAATSQLLLALSNTNKTILSGMNQFLEIRDQSGAVQFSFDVINNVLQTPNGGFSIKGTSLAAILTSSLVNTSINGSNSSIMQAGGNNIAIALVNGFSLFQRLNLPGVGSLFSTSTFTGNGSATVSHGLAAIPDFVAISCTAAGSSATFGYNPATATATLVTITAGAAVAWKAIAYKF